MRWLDALERLIAGPGATAGVTGAAGGAIPDARGLWLAWEEMPYPKPHLPGSDAAIVDGVDINRLNRDLAGLLRAHFDGNLDDLGRERLAGMVRTLERVVPQLRGEGRPYFAAAMAVARWIVRGSPT